MPPRLLAALVLLLVPMLAFAGAPITSFPAPPPAADSLLGANGLPVPGHAAALSAAFTLIPVGVGTGMVVAGFMSLDTGGDVAPSPFMLLAGVSLVAGGIVSGPAAGYHYGGLGPRGTNGVVLRLGLVLVPLVAAAAVAGSSRSGSESVALTAAVAGVCIATIDAIYDISTVEEQVRQRNARLARPVTWRIDPCVLPGARAPGLVVRAAFGGPRGS